MDIVLFFQSTTRLSWRRKLAGAYRFAREHNWFLQVVERFATPADVRKALANWQPVGCLVDRAMSAGKAPDAFFGDCPVVYLDQDRRGASRRHPCLRHDSGATASLAVKELLRLDCRSYAYLGTGKGYFWDRERLARFRKEARGRKVAELPNDWLQPELWALPKPCGVLAANDSLAVEVYHAAVSLGLNVPCDVAIVGIDNDEIYCESVTPGITSVEPDFEGAGYRLAEMLAAEIDRRRAGKRGPCRAPALAYGPLKIVRRGSSAADAGYGPRVRRAVEYIRRHACDPKIRLDGVIAAMGCSRKMATKTFRHETGKSILDSIHDARFDRACDLLASTNWPIDTVVAQTGYASGSFLKKMFLRRTGLTMREWRKRRTAIQR